MHDLESDPHTSHASALRAWRLFTIASVVATVCAMVAIIAVLAGWNQAAKHRKAAADATEEVVEITHRTETLEADRAELTAEVDSLRNAARELQNSYTSASTSMMDAEAEAARLQTALQSPFKLPDGAPGDLLPTDDALVVLGVTTDTDIISEIPDENRPLLRFIESQAGARGWRVGRNTAEGDSVSLVFSIVIAELAKTASMATVHLEASVFAPTRDGKRRVKVMIMSDFKWKIIGTDPQDADTILREKITELLDELQSAVNPVP